MWNAKLYDDRHAFVWKHGASLVELLAPKPGEHILDLGCGTGHLTAHIAAAGALVLGIDASSAMIDEARNAYPALRFEVADARALTFDRSFDAVFSNAALHWVKEAAAAVKGIARALKPGGRFVAEFGGHGNVRLILAAMQELVGPHAVSPWYFPGIGEYAGLLERHGMEVTFATLFDRPTPLEGADGLRQWVTMFGGSILNRVPVEQRDAFFEQLEDRLRPTLWRDGAWIADYRRLRVVALRLPEVAP
jgi:trans-aconitate methyltransferase